VAVVVEVVIEEAVAAEGALVQELAALEVGGEEVEGEYEESMILSWEAVSGMMAGSVVGAVNGGAASAGAAGAADVECGEDAESEVGVGDVDVEGAGDVGGVGDAHSCIGTPAGALEPMACTGLRTDLSAEGYGYGVSQVVGPAGAFAREGSHSAQQEAPPGRNGS
jgi:hypothetical protein